MSTNKRIGKKVAPFAIKEDAPGFRLDSGPYIGKIKNNLDSARNGRLQVWIPDIGAGDETDPLSWRTVSYASPFFGASSQLSNDKEKGYKNVRHTYGMWFTPPDVDNFVLCTFIAGDPLRGFWFACVPPQLGHHMVPAIGGSAKYDQSKVEDSTVKQAEKGDVVPVVEFNENADTNWSDFTNISKPIHEDHFKAIIEQGLNKDTTRGVITSSSQRESPSSVFGISTPGAPIGDEDEQLRVFGRKGGHTFVMDDGNYEEKNRLMRLRSSSGHQIMMNDSEEVFHIINGKGNVWLELAKDGSLNIFCDKDLNIRAKGNFNMHTDKDMYFHAEGTFKVCAKKEMHFEGDSITAVSTQKTTLYGSDINVGASGDINLNPKGAGSFTADGDLTFKGSNIKLNSGSGPTVDKPDPITVNDHAETEKQGVDWKSQDGKIKSIVKKVTTHEPWKRDAEGTANPAASGAASAANSNQGAAASETGPYSAKDTQKGFGQTSGAVTPGTGGVNVNEAGKTNFEGPAASQDAGPLECTGKGVKNQVDPSYMYRRDNPTPTREVGNLDDTQVKALKTQIAWNESRFDYGATERARGNFLGKYQFGSAALVDQGYIKPDAYAKYGTSAVQYPSSWTGKDGVNSKDAFLTNTAIQERSMDNLLDRNYKAMVRNGAIKPTDDASTVGGMLSTAHLLGAGGAKTWRQTGVGQDANRTTGGTYFNAGRHAVNTLGGTGRG
jgi:mannose-6-phosphate isomerase-like protein (cupin superfamily)